MLRLCCSVTLIMGSYWIFSWKYPQPCSVYVGQSPLQCYHADYSVCRGKYMYASSNIVYFRSNLQRDPILNIQVEISSAMKRWCCSVTLKTWFYWIFSFSLSWKIHIIIYNQRVCFITYMLWSPSEVFVSPINIFSESLWHRWSIHRKCQMYYRVLMFMQFKCWA
jgi:hypothetical protein